MNAKEVWRDIKGYENLYQVSSLGRVKALERKSPRNNRVYKEMIRRQETIKGGYKRVNLCKKGKTERILVHRLVATMFLDNSDNKNEVNHVNGQVYDNRVENLEWSTTKENSMHKTVVLNKKPRGVYGCGSKWRAQIVFDQNKIELGTFERKEDAYKSFYDKYIELRKEAPWDLVEYPTH